MPVVSELEMLRQEDGCELKLVWATGDPLCLEKKKSEVAINEFLEIPSQQTGLGLKYMHFSPPGGLSHIPLHPVPSHSTAIFLAFRTWARPRALWVLFG